MTSKIPIVKDIFNANNQIAREIRAVFDQKKILALNLMASPGAGKTSLILKLIEQLKSTFRLAVIEGDISSTIDADKIAARGIAVVQINTGGSCHLDALMIKKSLENIDLDQLDILIIENVGNLICPAEFDIGHHLNLVMSHVAEGSDKPYKYPGIFKVAHGVVLNKIDLMTALEFDQKYFENGLRIINQAQPLFLISCKTGDGINELSQWIMQQKKTLNL